MTLRVPVEPKILLWACERAGHGTDAYAEAFPALTGWISGETQPTLVQLERFAHATHTPVGYFFLREPPSESLPIRDFRTMANARRARPSPELMDTVQNCLQRQDWYRDYARTNGTAKLPFVGSVRMGDDVVRVAASMRRTLGFDLADQKRAGSWSDMLRRLIGLADDAGILVMSNGVVLNNTHRPLDPEEFRGFAVSDDIAPLIFVNGSDTKAAQMFTVGHELAHVWLGASGVSDSDAVAIADEEVERWCNRVAAEFLVPLESIRDDYDDAAAVEDEVTRLARTYRVSTLVVLRRLHDLGALSRDEFWSEYRRELERLRALKPDGGGGNFHLTQAARASKRFARALVVSTLEGQTLYRDAFRLLGIAKTSTLHALGKSLGVV